MKKLILQDRYPNMRQIIRMSHVSWQNKCAELVIVCRLPSSTVSLGFHVGEIALMRIYEDLWLFYRSKKAE